MLKGTVVLVPFPFTDLSGQKVRPALGLYNAKKGKTLLLFLFLLSQKETMERSILRFLHQ